MLQVTIIGLTFQSILLVAVFAQEDDEKKGILSMKNTRHEWGEL